MASKSGKLFDYTDIVKPGQFRRDQHGELRVMAICEGYAMCRRPRSAPHVRLVRELEQMPLVDRRDDGQK